MDIGKVPPHDTEAELNFLKTWCEDNNHPCEIANVWLNGGAGAKELANRVIELIENNNQTSTFMGVAKAKRQRRRQKCFLRCLSLCSKIKSHIRQAKTSLLQCRRGR